MMDENGRLMAAAPQLGDALQVALDVLMDIPFPPTYHRTKDEILWVIIGALEKAGLPSRTRTLGEGGRV